MGRDEDEDLYVCEVTIGGTSDLLFKHWPILYIKREKDTQQEMFFF